MPSFLRLSILETRDTHIGSMAGFCAVCVLLIDDVVRLVPISEPSLEQAVRALRPSTGTSALTIDRNIELSPLNKFHPYLASFLGPEMKASKPAACGQRVWIILDPVESVDNAIRGLSDTETVYVRGCKPNHQNMAEKWVFGLG